MISLSCCSLYLYFFLTLESPFFFQHKAYHTLTYKLTLLNEGAVDKPHGVVEGRGGDRAHRQSGRVQPVEEIYQRAHQQHCAGYTSPQRQVERGQARKHIHRLLRLPQQHTDGVVHVASGEVHHALPLWSDGQGWQTYICSLPNKKTHREPTFKTRSHKEQMCTCITLAAYNYTNIGPIQTPRMCKWKQTFTKNTR